MCLGHGRCSPPRGNHYDYQDRKGSSDTVLDILRERYAKGEITKEDFEQMKKDVTN
jgi:putative membrane protein